MISTRFHSSSFAENIGIFEFNKCNKITCVWFEFNLIENSALFWKKCLRFHFRFKIRNVRDVRALAIESKISSWFHNLFLFRRWLGMFNAVQWKWCAASDYSCILQFYVFHYKCTVDDNDIMLNQFHLSSTCPLHIHLHNISNKCSVNHNPINNTNKMCNERTIAPMAIEFPHVVCGFAVISHTYSDESNR